MRKLNLKQFLATAGAFTVISASSAEAGLAAASRLELVDVEPDMYLTAPLAVWFVAGSYISLSLLGRILRDLDGRPGPIQTVSTNPLGRPIPWHRNGKTSNVFASAVQSIFHQDEPEPEQRQRTIAWRVPVDDGQTVTVREHELREFLEAAARRTKHQLSERYWCRTRNMWTCRYKAYVRLLLEAGLVEGRYHGASGRLATKPQHCLSLLKYDSPYVL